MQRPRFNASPYEKGLYKTIDIEWTHGKKVPGSFFGSQIFNNFAQILDEWLTMDPGLVEYFGGKSLMSQSHGQSLMAFFKSRLKIKGLYLLDEPETALSPKTQLMLLNLLKEISQTGIAQFIIATHSPILLACPAARILSFDEIPVQQIDYHDTDHYQIYKDFMARSGYKLSYTWIAECKLLKRLFLLLPPYWKTIIISALLLVGRAALELVPPLFQREIIDEIITTAICPIWG